MQHVRHSFLVLPFVALCLLLQSCTKDKTLPPMVAVPLCDTAHVTYSHCVQPLLKAYCYECHSDSATQNGSSGLDIQDFSALKTYLQLYYHNDSIYGSKFYHTIAQTQGVLPMPPVGKLPENDLEIVRQWLLQGGPGN